MALIPSLGVILSTLIPSQVSSRKESLEVDPLVVILPFPCSASTHNDLVAVQAPVEAALRDRASTKSLASRAVRILA